jgi:hypothetical protein
MFHYPVALYFRVLSLESVVSVSKIPDLCQIERDAGKLCSLTSGVNNVLSVCADLRQVRWTDSIPLIAPEIRAGRDRFGWNHLAHARSATEDPSFQSSYDTISQHTKQDVTAKIERPFILIGRS